MRRSLMHLRVFVRAAAFTALAAALSSNSFAATIVLSDTFTKPDGNLVGTTPDVGTGTWNQTSTTATNPIQISGNQVAMGTSGQDVYAAFTTPLANVPGSSIHTGMDINVSAAQTGDY